MTLGAGEGGSAWVGVSTVGLVTRGTGEGKAVASGGGVAVVSRALVG